MTKLVIVWSNGDKQKIKVSEEYMKSFSKTHAVENWNKWVITSTDSMAGWNMTHAREYWIEKD